MAKRQKVIRTNNAYRVDGWVEFVVIVYKIVAWLSRLLFTWRTEVGLVAVVLTGYGYASRQQLVPAWSLTLAPMVVVAAWPWSRRLVLGRLACARARRRILACCRNTGVTNRDGKLPWIAKSRTTPVGERISLWLRPGQSAELLEDRIPELRAACRAMDAQVIRDRADASRVVIDVIRRDPLTAPVPMRSPLLDRAAQFAARPTRFVED